MTTVFGHANPDTDAITASLVYASFLRKSGQDTDAKSYRLGTSINPETEYVLSNVPKLPGKLYSLGGQDGTIDAPPTLDPSAIKPRSKVALVDHNESSQSLKELYDKDLAIQITAVIDHHKIGDLHTDEPLYCRIEPVGCTGTILYNMYKEQGLEKDIAVDEAHLMMSAILSDTLNFTSPTTTTRDKQAVEALAKICDCKDTSAYALSMFKAKSNVSNIPALDLVKLDYKVFAMPDGSKWGLGGLETVDVPSILSRGKELSQALDQVRQEGGLDGVFLCIVDVLQTKCVALLPANSTKEEGVVTGAYKTSLIETNGVKTCDLGDRISRKKQLVPQLTAHLKA